MGEGVYYLPYLFPPEHLKSMDVGDILAGRVLNPSASGHEPGAATIVYIDRELGLVGINRPLLGSVPLSKMGGSMAEVRNWFGG